MVNQDQRPHNILGDHVPRKVPTDRVLLPIEVLDQVLRAVHRQAPASSQCPRVRWQEAKQIAGF